MPNLRDIRRRISSVEKTQQITSAMRMVAAAKLRRAQESIEAARPYAERMRNTLSEVAASQTDAAHPLLVRRESVEKVEFVVVTSDRGLAGAFNANVLKRAEAMMKKCLAAGQALEITTAGRKKVIGRPMMYKTTKEFLVQFGLSDLSELPNLKEFEELSRAALGEGEEDAADEADPAKETREA